MYKGFTQIIIHGDRETPKTYESIFAYDNLS